MYLIKELIQDHITPLERLFQTVSDYDIYCELIGFEVPIGRTIKSPLRDVDDNPSFALYFPTQKRNTREEELWWTDFSLGSGDVFTFVRYFARYQEEIKFDRFIDIIYYIDRRLELNLFRKSAEESTSFVKRTVDYVNEKKLKSIFFKSRDYTKTDLKWWLRFSIDQELLEYYDVRSLQYILREDYTIKYTYRENELGFAFVVQDRVKIYNPNAGSKKWRNTCPSHYILGDEQREGTDDLIITKSLKDIMTFRSFLDIDVVAPQSESVGIPDDKMQEYLQSYKNIYVVFDYDPAGRLAAEKLRNLGCIVKWIDTNVVLINNKEVVKDKDISDYSNHHGIEATFKKLKEIFPELPTEVFKSERVDYLLELKANLSL